jgi:hypothetical protein
MTFKLTFVDPCLTTTIHVPTVGIPFPDLDTSVKVGSYSYSTFANFKDAVSQAF